MVKWLMKNRIDAFERKLGYDLSDARPMLDPDYKAFRTFARATQLGRYRRVWRAVTAGQAA
jgi:hypothetical protein